jgi:hypothetical protein
MWRPKNQSGGFVKGMDRCHIRDFFVCRQDKSSGGILAKEFRKCSIPQTW